MITHERVVYRGEFFAFEEFLVFHSTAGLSICPVEILRKKDAITEFAELQLYSPLIRNMIFSNSDTTAVSCIASFLCHARQISRISLNGDQTAWHAKSSIYIIGHFKSDKNLVECRNIIRLHCLSPHFISYSLSFVFIIFI